MFFTGIIIAVSTFLIIGLCHPLVIKTEDHTGTRLWWLFLVLGIVAVACALFVENVICSSLLGVVGASLLWSIGELFEQRKRVQKGWFPMNPKRKGEYLPADGDGDGNNAGHGRQPAKAESETMDNKTQG